MKQIQLYNKYIEQQALCKFWNNEDMDYKPFYYGILSEVILEDGEIMYEQSFKRAKDNDFFDNCEVIKAMDTYETSYDVENWGDKGSYLTDDRDYDNSMQNVLDISMGGNGDFYVSVRQKGHLGGKAVRLSTSGGASSHCPLLVAGISMAYRALLNKETPESIRDTYAPDSEFKRIED